MVAQYLGVFGGSVMGGQISAAFGIPSVLFVTSALMLLNAVWVYFRICRKIGSGGMPEPGGEGV